MILDSIILCTLLLTIVGSFWIILNMRKRANNSLSFKESMDLTSLPVVTFYNNNIKLNFLLDTGSDDSRINMSVLPLLKYELLDFTRNTMSILGEKALENQYCSMTISYKQQDFCADFSIGDFDEPFSAIKTESGVQIHGILGSLFFQKYKYILDFENLTAYLK